MDKSLKVGKDEWRERERGEQNFERETGESEASICRTDTETNGFFLGKVI